MNNVLKTFYKDVVSYLDYLEKTVSKVVSEAEERKAKVFKLLFMLILLKLFEDFRLVSKEEVKKIWSKRTLSSLLSNLYSILEKYLDIKFLKINVKNFQKENGLVEALRRVYEYESNGKQGWKGLKFYDFRKLGGGAILGDVYETFLGWSNKEGKKKMGVYYTPKLIVEYMCKESLFYYLLSRLEDKVSEDGLHSFVWGEDVSKIKDLEAEVDKLLAEVKVCDPSCGTGAFLTGMLNEIVRLRRLVSDVSVEEMKRNAIERSLYGIDIDERAVEICKIRLWFSLVENGSEGKVIPMSKLRFNITQGNALLLGFPKEWLK